MNRVERNSKRGIVLADVGAVHDFISSTRRRQKDRSFFRDPPALNGRHNE